MSLSNSSFVPKSLEISHALVLAIGVFSVFFNGVLLFVMVANSKQVFASLGSYFIANLAVADFITGLNSIVWGIEGFTTFNHDAKISLLSIFWITVQVSFYTIFVMSTERLVAIVFPFRTAVLMSRKKTVLYCAVVWLVAILGACLLSFNPKIRSGTMFSLTVVFEIVIVVIIIEYVFVFRQLRSLWLHSKKRALHTKDSTSMCSPSKRTTDLEREYQVTVVVVTLAIILFVTVIPYMVATQFLLGCILTNSSCLSNQSLNAFVWYYFPVELLNFVLNPIVYAWRLPKYRKAFLRTFRLANDKEGACNFSSNGSPKTSRSMCPTDKEIALSDC